MDTAIPIIVVTAFADEEHRLIAEIQSMALTEIVDNPVSPDKLLDFINGLN